MTAQGGARAMWALGDYHRFAKTLVWELGPVLVEACGISAGQRVLDVAAGTGERGHPRCRSRGRTSWPSDLTPENFEAGRREARRAGGRRSSGSRPTPRRCHSPTASSTSSPRRSARCSPPITRSCRRRARCACAVPGGTIGMVNFTPEGLAAEFFGVFMRRTCRHRLRRAALPPVAVGKRGARAGALRRPASNSLRD